MLTFASHAIDVIYWLGIAAIPTLLIVGLVLGQRERRRQDAWQYERARTRTHPASTVTVTRDDRVFDWQTDGYLGDAS